MATIQVYRPVPAAAPEEQIALAKRRPLAGGARIVLVNNGKPRTTELLTYMTEALNRHFPVASVTIHSKPSAGSPLDNDIADRLAAEADLVLTGLGDCGACSSCSLIDALMMEQRGIPASVIITDPFIDVCSRIAARMGCASYRPVMIPHPAASRSAEWLRDWADRSTPILLENLMGS